MAGNEVGSGHVGEGHPDGVISGYPNMTQIQTTIGISHGHARGLRTPLRRFAYRSDDAVTGAELSPSDRGAEAPRSSDRNRSRWAYDLPACLVDVSSLPLGGEGALGRRCRGSQGSAGRLFPGEHLVYGISEGGPVGFPFRTESRRPSNSVLERLVERRNAGHGLFKRGPERGSRWGEVFLQVVLQLDLGLLRPY